MTDRYIHIGPYRFATKTAAISHIRKILSETILGTHLQGDDFSLIRCLLNQHHDVDTKVGVGVSAISVDKNTMGSRSFWVHRVDGTAMDFSYRHAINGKPNHRQEILSALRWEIDYQIIAFRDWYFSQHADVDGRVVCSVTGLLISRKESHVDHVVRFVDLADYFVAWAGGYPALTYECSKIGAYGWLTDRQLGGVWQTWHQQNAQLRVIERRANLARNRKSGAKNASM